MAKTRIVVSRQEASSKFVPLLQTFHLYGGFGWTDHEFGSALEIFFKDFQLDPATEARKHRELYGNLTGGSNEN